MRPQLLPLAPYTARLRYRHGGAERVLELPVDPPTTAGEERVFDSADAALRLRLQLRAGENELRLTSEVTALAQGVTLGEAELLALTDTAEDPSLRAYHQGWESWSGSSSVGPAERERRPHFQFIRDVTTSPSAPRLAGPGHHSSELVTALGSKERGAVAAGFLTSAAQFGHFEMDLRPGAPAQLRARLPFEGVPLRAGASRRGETLSVWWGERADLLLERWAEELGRGMDARVPEHGAVGWCSWYYYFTKIDDGIIRENLQRLRELGEALPLDLFQIDDGYQAAIGDWLRPNRKFPQGVGPLAGAIDEAGYAPGLWLAPFIARREAPLYREHPDWFVRDARGRRRYALYNPMWGVLGSAKALDTTHPAVLDWLRQVFTTVTRDWGFRFVKIDFLYAAALPGRRHDPTATGAEALRRGLLAIREAVGPEVHILGCGCPLGPAVGLVDSMRIGIDVAPDWHTPLSRWIGRDYDMLSTSNALRNVLTRSFLHRRLWQNDPDCLLVREHKSRLSLDEVRALATLAALSGGTLLVSDNLSALPPARLAIARRAIALGAEVQGAHPRCLDLMEREYPTLLWAPRAAGGAWLAVLNPNDEPAPRTLDLRRYPELAPWASHPTLREEWSATDLPLTDGVLPLGTLPPHAVRLLRLPG